MKTKNIMLIKLAQIGGSMISKISTPGLCGSNYLDVLNQLEVSSAEELSADCCNSCYSFFPNQFSCNSAKAVAISNFQ